MFYFFSLRTRSEGYLSKISDEHQRSLFKTWCTFKYNQHFSEVKMIDRISVSQNEAVAQLKSISEALYLEAIQVWSLAKKVFFSIFLIILNTFVFLFRWI